MHTFMFVVSLECWARVNNNPNRDIQEFRSHLFDCWEAGAFR